MISEEAIRAKAVKCTRRGSYTNYTLLGALRLNRSEASQPLSLLRTFRECKY